MKLALHFLFVSAITALASVTYIYDAAGRLTAVDYGNGSVLTYSYDQAGNLISRSGATGGGGGGSCVFAVSLGGQAFGAGGGTGVVNITANPGCAWSVSGTPSWVTFTNGSGNGNGSASYAVAANTGGDRTASFNIAGQAFAVEQQGLTLTGLTYIGSMPHLAAEGGWTTTFTFMNKGPTFATGRTSLFAPDGTPLAIPLNLPQQSTIAGPLLASSLDKTIAPSALFVTQAAGPASVPYLEGSAQLAATASTLDGFAIFHFDPNAQEAVVPMETRNAASYLLAFDNTNGVVTGVAVANISAATANIPVVIHTDSGALVTSGSIALAANGHTSFVLSDPVHGFPLTANIRGTIEFDTPPGGQISVLGIRYTAGTLTTIPALANVGTTGGLMAHLASANGWQTTFVLVNTGASSAQANLKFFDDNGNPLPLPLTFPQPGMGSPTTAATLNQTIAAGQSLYVQSAGPVSAALLTGSAQLTASGNVGGFVIFRYNPNGQEAVVPLENRNASTYFLAYDNTAGTVTGVAISSVSQSAINVPITLRDDTGAVLGTGSILLGANGHTSFLLAQHFPQTAGLRGTIGFNTPQGAQISVLGIRSPLTLTFTTLPALAQ
jgi:YD repeat-containing protein